MGKIDKIKAQIDVLKIVFTTLIASVLGIVGWMATSYLKIQSWLGIAAIVILIMLTFIALIVTRAMLNKIDELEEL